MASDPSREDSDRASMVSDGDDVTKQLILDDGSDMDVDSISGSSDSEGAEGQQSERSEAGNPDDELVYINPNCTPLEKEIVRLILKRETSNCGSNMNFFRRMFQTGNALGMEAFRLPDWTLANRGSYQSFVWNGDRKEITYEWPTMRHSKPKQSRKEEERNYKNEIIREAKRLQRAFEHVAGGGSYENPVRERLAENVGQPPRGEGSGGGIPTYHEGIVAIALESEGEQTNRTGMDMSFNEPTEENLLEELKQADRRLAELTMRNEELQFALDDKPADSQLRSKPLTCIILVSRLCQQIFNLKVDRMELNRRIRGMERAAASDAAAIQIQALEEQLEAQGAEIRRHEGRVGEYSALYDELRAEGDKSGAIRHLGEMLQQEDKLKWEATEARLRKKLSTLEEEKESLSAQLNTEQAQMKDLLSSHRSLSDDVARLDTERRLFTNNQTLVHEREQARADADQARLAADEARAETMQFRSRLHQSLDAEMRASDELIKSAALNDELRKKLENSMTRSSDLSATLAVEREQMLAAQAETEALRLTANELALLQAKEKTIEASETALQDKESVYEARFRQMEAELEQAKQGLQAEMAQRRSEAEAEHANRVAALDQEYAAFNATMARNMEDTAGQFDAKKAEVQQEQQRQAELQQQIRGLESELEQKSEALNRDVADEVRQRIQQELAEFRSNVQSQHAEIEQQIRSLKEKITQEGDGLMVKLEVIKEYKESQEAVMSQLQSQRETLATEVAQILESKQKAEGELADIQRQSTISYEASMKLDQLMNESREEKERRLVQRERDLEERENQLARRM
ncbi:hypothetical protein F4810DRAFT_709967 [Camillea tinctor]|nr:hypothetical protein F4810DRAFT_709967 [Camillea tinctor]